MKVFPKIHTDSTAQETYTPEHATMQIVPFLDKSWSIWEMCYGQGHMANTLKEQGFNVVGERGVDCFKWEPENYDCIVTNPPYRNNKDFLERAIKSSKPFALLMRLEHLRGVKASKLLKNLDIKVLIPEKRINFITSKMRDGIKTGGSPFHTVWITYNIVKSTNQILYI